MQVAANEQEGVGAGSVPAHILRMIKELSPPQIDWRSPLRQFVKSMISRGYSYIRPNKKVRDRRIILPSYRRFDKKLDIAIAIDTSGSIGAEFLTDFFSEIRGMLETFPKYTAHVFCFDADVDKASYVKMDGNVFNGDYDLKSYIKNNVIGGGGTRFQAAWDFMRENKIAPSGMVMLTDGYPYDTDWHGEHAYCNAVFLVKGNENWKAPFGRTIHLPWK